MSDPSVPPGGEVVEDDPPWEAWTPAQAAARLAGLDVPWAVAAGWALPLLAPAQRAWLAAALARVHPGHHWLSRLR